MIWSSGKILELMIRSMISRQQLSSQTRLFSHAWKNPQEIEDSIQGVIKLYRFALASRGITYEFKNLIDRRNLGRRRSSSQKSFSANWEMFLQALFHPIANAVKFSKDQGHIVIQVELRELPDSNDHELLHVSILDNGVGIHPEDKK